MAKASGDALAAQLASWSEPASDACAWSGVECLNNAVVELRLAGAGLVGPLPSEISCFTGLRKLDLSGNGLVGNIPPELSRLASLTQFNTSNNALRSGLPMELSHLTRLQELDLSDNLLTGVLSPEWSALAELRALHLSRNGLVGTLPTEWSALRQLRRLSLTGVRGLSGGLPSTWLPSTGMAQLTELSISANLSGAVELGPDAGLALRALDLSRNPFLGEGGLPAALVALPHLEALNLSASGFAGHIPPALLTSSSLKNLDLSFNALTGSLPEASDAASALVHLHLAGNPSLGGPLPASFSSLTALQSLRLHGNDHTGPLPSAWTSLPALRELDLSRLARVAGRLPPSWSAMASLEELIAPACGLRGLPPSWGALTTLRHLNLEGNPLEAQLPAEWSDMRSIECLQLGGAGISGTLPAAWSALGATLEDLDLRENHLEGEPPRAWASSMGHLKQLLLHVNRLRGSLPVEYTAMPSLYKLALRSNAFTGTISPAWAAAPRMAKLVLSENQLTGTIPPQLSALSPSTLKILWLGEQALTGGIPPAMCALTRMEMLHIHSAGLSGPIPDCLGDLPNLKDLSLSNNALTGTLPASLGHAARLSKLQLAGNLLSGTVPTSLAAAGNNFRALGLCVVPPDTDQCFTCPNIDYTTNSNPKCDCPPAPHNNVFQCAPAALFASAGLDMTCVEAPCLAPAAGTDSADGHVPVGTIALGACAGMVAALIGVAGLLYARHWRRRAATCDDGDDDEEALTSSDNKRMLGGSSDTSVHGSSGSSKELKKGSWSSSLESGTITSLRMGNAGSGQHHVVPLELLGTGATARVYRGQWKGVMVAHKIMNLPANPRKLAKMRKAISLEATISASMRHPNVVQTFFFEIVPIDEPGADAEPLGAAPGAAATMEHAPGGEKQRSGVLMWQARIIQEYCSGGSLRDALTAGALEGQCAGRCPPSAGAALSLAHDVARGMFHIHTCQVIHGDLKCCNVLLQPAGADIRRRRTSLQAKVADFGLALQMADEQSHISGVRQGTITHMAPELLSTGRATTAADVYAFGVLLFELFTAQRPWSGQRAPAILQAVVHQGERPVFPPSTPASVVKLARNCWQAEPSKRPGFEAVVGSLVEMLRQMDIGEGLAPMDEPPLVEVPPAARELCETPVSSAGKEIRAMQQLGGSFTTGSSRENRPRTIPRPPMAPINGSASGDNSSRVSFDPSPGCLQARRSTVGTMPASGLSAKKSLCAPQGLSLPRIAFPPSDSRQNPPQGQTPKRRATFTALTTAAKLCPETDAAVPGRRSLQNSIGDLEGDQVRLMQLLGNMTGAADSGQSTKPRRSRGESSSARTSLTDEAAGVLSGGSGAGSSDSALGTEYSSDEDCDEENDKTVVLCPAMLLDIKQAAKVGTSLPGTPNSSGSAFQTPTSASNSSSF